MGAGGVSEKNGRNEDDKLFTPFKDELDLLKFICKDFWGAIFRKQIDNLRTNHQGT